ncbi:MAG: hypothetical protein LBB76_06655 [Azoarcus sp.]|jgi:hypothetical protein|nr:hypothetical protein [Azoarcus sp.]
MNRHPGDDFEHFLEAEGCLKRANAIAVKLLFVMDGRPAALSAAWEASKGKTLMPVYIAKRTGKACLLGDKGGKGNATPRPG